MRIGIVFYSRTGTGRTVAERLASITGWEVHEVRDASPRIGLAGDLRCVTDCLFKRQPEIRYAGPALDQFDHVILIAPVWLRSLAAPMRSFLMTQGRLIKTYSAICVMSGYGGFRAVDDIAAVVGAKPSGILLLKQYDVLAEECDASLCRFKERTLAAWESGGSDSLLSAVD